MRLCLQCRTPIENRAAACPQCGAGLDNGPRANPAPDPPRPGLFRRLAIHLFDLLHFLPSLILPLLLLGGLIGNSIGGTEGMIGGVIAGIALTISIQMVAE